MTLSELPPPIPQEVLDKRYKRNENEIIAIKTEVYSRVVGYYRPVSGWNKGKREEFKDRVSIDIKPMMEEG